jgi:hypothetical protein
METFDDISCEEYNQAFGMDAEVFAEWVQAWEADVMDTVNAELREIGKNNA